MSLSLHEKIQLSTDDIRYLQKLFLKNAHSKLSLNLPSSSQDTKDPLTLRIVNMIENFIYEIFEMSRHSLVIDGQDMATVENLRNILDQPKEQIEPFDIELNQELRKIYQQVEQETLEVTMLRRDFPSKAQDEYRDMIDKNYDSQLQTLLKEIAEQEETTEDKELIPRSQEFMDDYNETLKALDSLKEKIPFQTSEVEKLNDLVKVLQDISG